MHLIKVLLESKLDHPLHDAHLYAKDTVTNYANNSIFGLITSLYSRIVPRLRILSWAFNNGCYAPYRLFEAIEI